MILTHLRQNILTVQLPDSTNCEIAVVPNPSKPTTLNGYTYYAVDRFVVYSLVVFFPTGAALVKDTPYMTFDLAAMEAESFKQAILANFKT